MIISFVPRKSCRLFVVVTKDYMYTLQKTKKVTLCGCSECNNTIDYTYNYVKNNLIEESSITDRFQFRHELQSFYEWFGYSR